MHPGKKEFGPRAPRNAAGLVTRADPNHLNLLPSTDALGPCSKNFSATRKNFASQHFPEVFLLTTRFFRFESISLAATQWLLNDAAAIKERLPLAAPPRW